MLGGVEGEGMERALTLNFICKRGQVPFLFSPSANRHANLVDLFFLQNDHLKTKIVTKGRGGMWGREHDKR